jgi:uroporphyrinogen decarboxylase
MVMGTAMTSRERVRRALTRSGPDRAPRDLWVMPTVRRCHARELGELQARFPTDFANAPLAWGPSQRAEVLDVRGDLCATQPAEAGAMVGAVEFRQQFAARCITGRFRDEWGSIWRALEPGVVGEVAEPALPDWSGLRSYVLPHELLDGLDVEESHAFYAESERFVLAQSSVQPFQRLMFLRGMADLMLDLGYGRDGLKALLALLHEYYLQELRVLATASADAIVFKDDWGTQTGLLISPRQWRALFKPLYADYCDLIHRAGKFAFFHSDGHIAAIYPDLIELGVDAINSQLFCMDIEALAENYCGRITLWGEIDRQRILPSGTPDEVRAAVRRVRSAFERGAGGGLIAQCEWGTGVPKANLAACFESWLEPLDGRAAGG